MSQPEFTRRFIREFSLEEVEVQGQTELFGELGLDSFDALKLLIWIEGVADAIPQDDIPFIFCVDDAYRFYKSLMSSR